jgi:hypothetical protein
MYRMTPIILLLLVGASGAGGQDGTSQPCDDGAFRQFDFWIGEWKVHDAEGKHAGDNAIASEHNGCVVVERWTSARGGTGMSMNHYDPRAGLWRQHWVGLGLILEMSGGMKDGSMILEGPLQYVGTDRVTLLRGVWTPLPGGRVRQHFLESSDEGKTWSDWFDGYYSRAVDSGKPRRLRQPARVCAVCTPAPLPAYLPLVSITARTTAGISAEGMRAISANDLPCFSRSPTTNQPAA